MWVANGRILSHDGRVSILLKKSLFSLFVGTQRVRRGEGYWRCTRARGGCKCLWLACSNTLSIPYAVFKLKQGIHTPSGFTNIYFFAQITCCASPFVCGLLV